MFIMLNKYNNLSINVMTNQIICEDFSFFEKFTLGQIMKNFENELNLNEKTISAL